MDQSAGFHLLQRSLASHRACPLDRLLLGKCGRGVPGNVPEPFGFPRPARCLAGRGPGRGGRHPHGPVFDSNLDVGVRVLARHGRTRGVHLHACARQSHHRRHPGRCHGELAVLGRCVLHQARRRPQRHAPRHHLLAHGQPHRRQVRRHQTCHRADDHRPRGAVCPALAYQHPHHGRRRGRHDGRERPPGALARHGGCDSRDCLECGSLGHDRLGRPCHPAPVPHARGLRLPQALAGLDGHGRRILAAR